MNKGCSSSQNAEYNTHRVLCFVVVSFNEQLRYPILFYLSFFSERVAILILFKSLTSVETYSYEHVLFFLDSRISYPAGYR